MSMLPDPSLEGFLEHTYTIEQEYTVSEWASIAAGLLMIIRDIEQQEARKGPMPPAMRRHHAVLSEFVQTINMRMKIEEAEFRQIDTTL